ncbi:MAG: hypothetical protein GWN79_09155 [Actinobacteria bacterium]|nr:hypothetical protein [Actinomycetota bacterium]NIS31223.1 hypothetical protein [Actinomycetota bacterium]NIT95542.1 hypothetical protein [Actinomycetota bacterium]NIU19237.1 hypothetical protein [Actinomycetota bacterium]NIU66361.1 hypothetical protein [Actinomycetota bacterium]
MDVREETVDTTTDDGEMAVVITEPVGVACGRRWMAHRGAVHRRARAAARHP